MVFTFVEMLPGNIVDTLVGTEGNNDPEVRLILEKEYGLDQPVYVRYAKWLYRAVQLDFGKSLVTRRPVTVELLQGIPATVYLAVVGIIPIDADRGAAWAQSRRSGAIARRLHGAGDVAGRHLNPRVLVRYPLRAAVLALSRLAAVVRLHQPVRRFLGQPAIPDPAGRRDRLSPGRLHDAADAFQHARRNEQGIRRHRPVAGA